jgi:hypothetical protein
MIRISIRWRGKCKRHPNYQPWRGLQAIKGGCPACERLWRIHQAEMQLRQRMADFEETEEQGGFRLQ